MSASRNFLLVVLLIFAQLLSGAHALEHARGDDKKEPAGHCQLCLATHDLGGTLPSAFVAVAPQAPAPCPEQPRLHARAAVPAPLACQRGPPAC